MVQNEKKKRMLIQTPPKKNHVDFHSRNVRLIHLDWKNLSIMLQFKWIFHQIALLLRQCPVFFFDDWWNYFSSGPKKTPLLHIFECEFIFFPNFPRVLILGPLFIFDHGNVYGPYRLDILIYCWFLLMLIFRVVLYFLQHCLLRIFLFFFLSLSAFW